MEKWTSLYEKAWKLAEKAHEGQVDHGGNPYIEHPLAVADRVGAGS